MSSSSLDWTNDNNRGGLQGNAVHTIEGELKHNSCCLHTRLHPCWKGKHITQGQFGRVSAYSRQSGVQATSTYESRNFLGILEELSIDRDELNSLVGIRHQGHTIVRYYPPVEYGTLVVVHFVCRVEVSHISPDCPQAIRTTKKGK